MLIMAAEGKKEEGAKKALAESGMEEIKIHKVLNALRTGSLTGERLEEAIRIDRRRSLYGMNEMKCVKYWNDYEIFLKDRDAAEKATMREKAFKPDLFGENTHLADKVQCQNEKRETVYFLKRVEFIPGEKGLYKPKVEIWKIKDDFNELSAAEFVKQWKQNEREKERKNEQKREVKRQSR